MSENPEKTPSNELEQAARESAPGLVREFWNFLKESKKWWLVPLLGAFAILGALVLLGGSGLAPFIYSLF